MSSAQWCLVVIERALPTRHCRRAAFAAHRAGWRHRGAVALLLVIGGWYGRRKEGRKEARREEGSEGRKEGRKALA
ncbi:hypothetical protein ACU4GD_37870 [Cupriavidus basilensis]